MVKRYYYESDYLKENKTLTFSGCLYCGSKLSENMKRYCSDQCKIKDAIWHCDDTAI